MRDISALTTYLAQETGLESRILVEIDWGGTTGVVTYSKRTGGEASTPTLIDCGNLSQTKSHKIFCAIQSTSIQLRDLSGTLRNLVETTGIEGKPCTIYQSFDINGADKCIVFAGRIEGPISWAERTRILSFDVVSSPNDILLGVKLTEEVLASSPFSAVPNISQQAKDEILPLVIGCVENAPAFKLTDQYEAITASRTIFYHTAVTAPETPASTYIDLKATKDNEIIFNGYTLASITRLEIDGIIIPVSYVGRVTPAGVSDANGVFYRFDIDWLATEVYPSKYDTVANPILTAERDPCDPDFENPKVFWLAADGYNLVNNFVGLGNTPGEAGTHGTYAFVRCSKQEGRKCYFEEMWTEKYDVTINSIGYLQRRGYLVPSGVSLEWVSVFTPPDYLSSWLDACDEANMTRIYDIGSRVRIWNLTVSQFGFAPEIYIVNSAPSTITSVKAPVSRKNVPQEVPFQTTGNSYYQIVNNWGGSTFTALILRIPLSEYPEEGWGDNILVSQRSSTAVAAVDGTTSPTDPWGNASKAIEYLLGEYAPGFSTDTSFDTVATKIANYPMGIYLTSQRSVFEVVGEIAYQSRCLLTLDGTVFKIRYLSETPTSVMTINDDLVLEASLILSWSEKQDLMTRLSYQYRKSYDLNHNKLSLTENLSLNPTGEMAITFDHYHTEALAKVSAGFWLKRVANLWRRFTFNLPLEGLALELHDPVTISFAGILGSYTNLTGSIMGEVIASAYDIENKIVKITVELPVAIGATTVNAAYWTITGVASRPDNVVAPDIKAYNLIKFFYPIEPHTFESHSNINRYRRKSTEGVNLTSNALQDGDVLSYDSATGQFVPTSPASVVYDGTGGTGAGTVINCLGYVL